MRNTYDIHDIKINEYYHIINIIKILQYYKNIKNDNNLSTEHQQ